MEGLSQGSYIGTLFYEQRSAMRIADEFTQCGSSWRRVRAWVRVRACVRVMNIVMVMISLGLRSGLGVGRVKLKAWVRTRSKLRTRVAVKVTGYG